MLASVSLADVRSRAIGKVEGIVHTFVHSGVGVRLFTVVDMHTITRVLAFTGWEWEWRRLGCEVE